MPFNKLEYIKQYNRDHREEANARNRRYYSTHKEERRAHQRQYNLEHKTQRRIYDKEYHKRHNLKLKCEVLNYYSNGRMKCNHCGIGDIDVLCIDHIDGNGGKHRKIVGTGTEFYSWLKKNNFPNGYQILCFNCNMKKHIATMRLVQENKGDDN